MSEQRVVFLRQGLVGTCVIVALVLLGIFYSTVSGAVDRARQRQTVAAEAWTRTPAPAVQRPSPRASPLLARVGG